MNTAPDLYGWGNRFAMFTGNPVVVGWDWHEHQQRGQVPGDLVTRRIHDVQAAYASVDASFAYRTLEGYGVQYVVSSCLPGGSIGLSKLRLSSCCTRQVVWPTRSPPTVATTPSTPAC
jgi:uncharacterized membrane protein